jgi:hypothetical protein
MQTKQKTKKITIWADPGHGWAKVTRHEVEKLGIAFRISSYSYQRKGYVFLEEDCDLELYIQALKSRGYVLTFKTFYTNKRSKIRLYENYTIYTGCQCCC